MADQTLALVGAVGGGGTTRTAVEFGATLARDGRDVALLDAAEYLPRFASKLDLSTAVERRAAALVERARQAGLDNGRNPCGIAAACLYTASEERDGDLTQTEAAAVADVTPVTLRRTYSALSADETASASDA